MLRFESVKLSNSISRLGMNPRVIFMRHFPETLCT